MVHAGLHHLLAREVSKMSQQHYRHVQSMNFGEAFIVMSFYSRVAWELIVSYRTQDSSF